MAVIMPPNTSASLCEIESESTAQLKFNEAPLSNFYELGDELGCGQFASVRRVVERSTGDLYAAKFVRKRRYATSRRGVPRESIEREVQVLRLVSGHENVIELKEVFETPTDIILILELVSGGELFDHVCANEYLDEQEASAFIKQILYGIQHLHRNHVVHMDIKPENIMLKKKNESQIKLIDFGLSRIILPGSNVKEMVGTPEFVAPEVVNYESLSTATDMWALGVVCYILLSGGSPFLGRNRNETFENITSVRYHEVNYLSKPAKDFIARLFVRDMRKRATVEDCLRHPWIRPEAEFAEMRRTSSIITGSQLKSFKIRMRWRKATDLVRLCVQVTRRERIRVKEAQRSGNPVKSRYDKNDVVTSAILLASEEGNLDALEQLVNIHRLDLNVTNQLQESPLHFASSSGNEKVVAYLLRRGLNVEAEDSRGDTPLFYAARNGHAKLIRFMCAGSNRLVVADVNKQNKSLESPLIIAVRYLQIESALALLESGANVNIQDESGESALHISAWDNSNIILSILCRFNPILSLTNKFCCPNCSFTHEVSLLRNNCLAAVKLESRLTKDAKLSARELYSKNDTFTVVDHQFNDSDLSSELPSSDEEEIRNSARVSEVEGFPEQIFVPSATDSAINTASSSSTSTKAERVIHQLLADPEKVASTDFNELVSTLTNSLSKLDPEESTKRIDPITNPFHPLYSSKAKRPILPLEGGNENFDTPILIPRLESLHTSNADIKRPSEVLVGLSQHNPFRLEAWNEDKEHLAATARPYNGTKTHENLDQDSNYNGDDEHDSKTGCDDELRIYPVRLSSSLPNTTRKSAPCAISYTASSVFIQLVNSAFEAGLGVPTKFFYDGCCTDSETALHLAATRGHIECVQSLLEAGSPLDTQDGTGQSALHLSLRRSHTEIALLLIAKGCNYDLADENGDTPLIIAARIGLVNAAQTLCHIGAALNIQNKQMLTALLAASQEGHLEVVRCLLLAGADVNLTNKDDQTAEMLAIQNGHENVANLLAKVKSEAFRDQCIEQLCLLDTPLRRIKLKLFGHSGVGKTRLVQSLQSSSMIGSLIDAVSRRFSDNLNTSNSTIEKSKRMSDEGIHSCSSSTSSESTNHVPEKKAWTGNFKRPVHPNYTTGIDVQNVNFPGCGEYSCWEFGGYDPYHVLYDHFVGNTDCIHLIVISCSDPTEVQYKEVLYWMNFLKGRVTPSEPISHCGVVSRLSKVVVVGAHATPSQFPTRNLDGEYTNSDVDAMLKTIRLRFETHFDIHDRLILLDSTNASCPGMKALRQYLHKARDSIVARLQKPLALLDNCTTFMNSLRKTYANFPVITWPHFTTVIRNEVNPLTSDSHCRQLIQQLQLIGEVVYLRDEACGEDYVVLTPEWLGTHILGTLLSAQFLSNCRQDGCYTVEQFGPIFPEISELDLLVRMLDTLQMCAPIDESRFEFPAFIFTEAPKDIWLRNKPNFVYGGLRILPMRGMERSLQSTFVRLQVGLRRSMNDFSDPMDADLHQYLECSKMSSGKMEALVCLKGDAVEIQVRGPPDMSASCVYFLEDIANLVEQTCSEVAPGIALERHFLSPKHLREHRLQPATFPPEVIMAMQQRESLSIHNTDDEEELFTDVVCFGSREVARVLTLGVDVSVSQLQLTARCELAALLDPPDKFGRDWSILAVKLNLTDQLPEVDSTGQSLSRTDQLLAEWALQAPETASIGRLCSILEEMGRADARDLLFRTVPLYLFANLDENHVINDLNH